MVDRKKTYLFRFPILLLLLLLVVFHGFLLRRRMLFLGFLSLRGLGLLLLQPRRICAENARKK